MKNDIVSSSDLTQEDCIENCTFQTRNRKLLKITAGSRYTLSAAKVLELTAAKFGNTLTDILNMVVSF